MIRVDYNQLLQELLEAAPTPSGWARWSCAVWAARGLQSSSQEVARDVLMQLLSISPRPRSYKQWIKRLEELEEIIGSAYCVSCHKVFPLGSLTHRESGQRVADIAGLICSSCKEHIRSGNEWPVCSSGLPLLSGTYRYKLLRHQHDRQSTISTKDR